MGILDMTHVGLDFYHIHTNGFQPGQIGCVLRCVLSTQPVGYHSKESGDEGCSH